MQDSDQFKYLSEVAGKYGTLYTSQDLQDFVANVNSEQLKALADAYQRIAVNNHSKKISSWINYCFTYGAEVGANEVLFAQQVGQLFPLFRHLAAKNIAPFSSGGVAFIDEYKKPDWTTLPNELEYLIDAAQLYGVYYCESDILAFLDLATERDRGILAGIAERIRINGHAKTINQWLDLNPLDKHHEACLVYFLLGVLDHAGLKFE